MNKVEHCRSCGAPIVWRKFNRPPHKAAPIDAAPRPDGNILLSGPYYYVLGKAALAEEPGSGERFTNHFQTCPQAEKWGKR